MRNSEKVGVIIHKLDQGKPAQNRMISIMACSPHVPNWRKRPAISNEKGSAATQSNPNGNTHSPRMGTTVRFAGMVTRETR